MKRSSSERGLAIDNPATFSKWRLDYCEPSSEKHYDGAIRRMLKLIKARPGLPILDAGCGTGVHSIRAAKQGLSVIAVDVSSAALSEAKVRAKEHGLTSRIEFQRGDIRSLPFPDEAFHALFSWGVVIHIEEIDVALRELVRVLKPGGRLALQVTNYRSMDFCLERLARKLLRKPRPAHTWTPWGFAGWDRDSRGRMWNNWMDVCHLARTMEAMGLKRVHHGPSELTELQRRSKGAVRSLLRKSIELWFVLQLPARVAATNLLVFEKQDH